MKKLGMISLVLWVITVGAFAYFFIMGRTVTSSDNRKAVILDPQEKDMVLGEMRTILTAINGVLNSIAKNDMKGAASAAKSAGMNMAVDASPVFMAKLPIEFKTLGMSLHADFDTLSSDIEKGMTENQIVERLGAITNKCIACHSNYRLQ